MSKIEETAKPLGFNVRKGNYKVTLSLILLHPSSLLFNKLFLFEITLSELSTFIFVSIRKSVSCFLCIYCRWSCKVTKVEGKASSLWPLRYITFAVNFNFLSSTTTNEMHYLWGRRVRFCIWYSYFLKHVIGTRNYWGLLNSWLHIYTHTICILKRSISIIFIELT